MLCTRLHLWTSCSRHLVADRLHGSAPAPLTVDEHHGLLDGVLVAELGVEQRSADEGAVVGGLVPAHVKVVDVHVAQRTHHLHLVLDYRQRGGEA